MAGVQQSAVAANSDDHVHVPYRLGHIVAQDGLPVDELPPQHVLAEPYGLAVHLAPAVQMM